jgi:hypothetical protein
LERGRRWWHDELLAAGIALLAAAPLLAGRCYHIGDALTYGLPIFGTVQHAVAAGRPVAWVPELFTGFNALGAGQQGLYYPVNWLLLACFKLVAAFRLSFALHFWLLARGLVGLARRLGLPTVGVAGVTAAATLSGAVCGHVVHYNIIVGMAWTTPILWLTAILAAEPQAAAAVGLLAAAVALSILQSHPQYVVTALLISLTLLPWLKPPEVRPGVVARRLLLGWCGGGLLAACQVLPLIEYSVMFPRPHPGGHYRWFTSISFAPRDFARMFVPDALGSPFRGGYEPVFEFWECRAFLGLALTALAVARVAQRPWDRLTRGALALTLGAAVLMIGRFNPLWHILCRVPPLSLLRAPARLVWAFQVGLALLAGGGLSLVAEGRLTRPAARRGAAVAVGGALLALLASAGTHHLAAPGVAGWALAAVGAAAALSLPRLTGPRAAAALLAVGLVELTAAWHTLAVTRPDAWFAAPPLVAPIVADANPRLFVFDSPEPAAQPDLARDELERNFGLIHGVSYLQGWEALAPVGHLGLLATMERASVESPPVFRDFLDRYSVRWFLRRGDGQSFGLEPAARDGDLQLYRNPTARPWAYAVDRCWRDANGVLTPAGQVADILPVEIVKQSPEHWVLRVHADRPVAVVLSQSFYSGWDAVVDGRPQPVSLAEKLLMATDVPAGDHTVEFRFDNYEIWLGRYLSGLAWTLWLVLMLAARRFRTRAPAATAPPPAD